jgi:hypothetical protein
MLEGIAAGDAASATWDTQSKAIAADNGGMKIDVVHIDECPNWEDAGKVLAEVLDELGITEASITFTLISTPEDAAAHHFAGSPTILIDGVDAVPGAELTIDLACRIYRDGPRTAGRPSKETLRQAVLSRGGSNAS